MWKLRHRFAMDFGKYWALPAEHHPDRHLCIRASSSPRAPSIQGLRPVSGDISVKGAWDPPQQPRASFCPKEMSPTPHPDPANPTKHDVCSEQLPLPASWLMYPAACQTLIRVQQEKGHNFPRSALCPRGQYPVGPMQMPGIQMPMSSPGPWLLHFLPPHFSWRQITKVLSPPALPSTWCW